MIMASPTDTREPSQPESSGREPSQPASPGTSPLPEDTARNVGDRERWLSLLGGGLLALYTLRRSMGTGVLLGVAGALMYRGLKGQCMLYDAMGISTATPPALEAPRPSHEQPPEPSLIVLASA